MSLCLLLGPALPGPASAAVPAGVRQVIRDYRADGRIDPCKHSAEDLRATLKAVSSDTEQYAPDFPEAVRAAIEARAGGACDPGATPTPTPTPTSTPTETPTPTPEQGGGAAPAPPAPPAPSPPAPPGPSPSPVPGAGITPGVPTPAPTPAVLLRPTVAPADPAIGPAALLSVAGLLLLCLVAGAALALARRFGWGEERLAGVRHALAEAGWRTGGTWQDFTDWVRLGR